MGTNAGSSWMSKTMLQTILSGHLGLRTIECAQRFHDRPKPKNFEQVLATWLLVYAVADYALQS